MGVAEPGVVEPKVLLALLGVSSVVMSHLE